MARRDEMSFRSAFADARRELGAGGTFTWRGNRYTTDYAEEPSSSSSRSSSRSVEEIRRSASAAIDSAEGRPRARPQPNPRRTTSSNEATATRVDTPDVEVSRLPEPVERVITRSAQTESEEARARRAAVQSYREGESTDFITSMLRDLFSGFRERRERARASARTQASENAARNERLRELRGMNKGGTVRNGKMDRRKKGMFYDSKSPRGYK